MAKLICKLHTIAFMGIVSPEEIQPHKSDQPCSCKGCPAKASYVITSMSNGKPPQRIKIKPELNPVGTATIVTVCSGNFLPLRDKMRKCWKVAKATSPNLLNRVVQSGKEIARIVDAGQQVRPEVLRKWEREVSEIEDLLSITS
jgi:hypothetical protein